MSIRRAKISDAEELAWLSRKTFDSTFSGHPKNHPVDMAEYMDSAFGIETIKSELKDSNSIWLIYEIDKRAVGYLKLKLNSSEECLVAKNPIELSRLYVLKDFQGRGIGRDLMLRAIAEAESNCADILWLGVWEFNEKAISFYEKSGFNKKGEHIFMLGNDPQIDWIFARAI